MALNVSQDVLLFNINNALLKIAILEAELDKLTRENVELKKIKKDGTLEDIKPA